MPYWSVGQADPYEGFSRGMDRDSPRTRIAEGHYEEALNMLLTGDESGQHLATMRKDIELDGDITWQPGNLFWFAPFTYSTYDTSSGVLAFETHLLLHRDTGAFWRYDFGAPGVETVVRRLSRQASQLTTHFIYDQWLIILNGRDAPQKYGQHFRFDGQGHEVPYLFPLGSKPISPLDEPITGETWAFTGTSAFVDDTLSPGGGARVGSNTVLVGPDDQAKVTFAAARNFLAGPRPYGGTDFTNTDFFQFQYFKAANDATPDLRVRFYKTDPTVYREYLVATPTVGTTWTLASILRTGTNTGGFTDADMATIIAVEFRNNDSVNNVYVDDPYFLYANAAPAGAVGTAHKDRVILGGVPVAGTNADPALSTIFYSPSSKPDEFPSTNTQIITGGSQSLSRTNRITALREYGDSVIVGTQNSIIAWTIGTDGAPSRSVITTETGIDSSRAIVETPAGSLVFPWQRGYYILRQTGRNYVSEKINPLLKNVWLEEPWWTIGIRDEKTKSIRFWFREFDPILDVDDPADTTAGVVFDYVRSQETGGAVWSSRMDQLADYATEAYVDGVRETLYCNFNAQGIMRLGVQAGGEIESSLTLPWLSTNAPDHIGRWVGISVPYVATADVRVFLRTANHPGEFETAPFVEKSSLVKNPNMKDTARVMFGENAKWAQIKFQAQDYGFEILPPISLVGTPTVKHG